MSKTDGLVLAIDPGSNAAGISLWKDGQYIASTTLVAGSQRDPYSKRLQDLVPQLSGFLDIHIANDQIGTLVCEGVRARIVQVALGAFLTEPRIRATLSPTKSFIESMTWKKYARVHGATGEMVNIKGIKALQETGWDMEKYPVGTDDAADSILIFLAWKDR